MVSVHLLGNPAARNGPDRLDAAAASLRRAGAEPVVLRGATASESLEAASAAVADGAGRLLALGGDGVVNIAVNAVAGSDTILGVVPDGTGNDFARALDLLGGGLDEQIDRALGNAAPVDAIRTNHGWVATVATLGFSGDVTARANAMRWPRGQFRYTVATLLQLPRLRTLPVRIEVDGEPLGTDTTLLAVGNTAYFGGGMRICPDARTDDGLLQAVNIGDVPRLRFLRVFPTVFRGRHVRRPEVSTAAGTRAEITGDGIELWADGEPLGQLPVTLELVPAALRVAGVSPRPAA